MYVSEQTHRRVCPNGRQRTEAVEAVVWNDVCAEWHLFSGTTTYDVLCCAEACAVQWCGMTVEQGGPPTLRTMARCPGSPPA
jgi:hypothetical protein